MSFPDRRLAVSTKEVSEKMSGAQRQPKTETDRPAADGQWTTDYSDINHKAINIFVHTLEFLK